MVFIWNLLVFFVRHFCNILCSPQINLASVDESTGRMTGGFTTYICYLRRHPQVRPDILSVVAKGMCPGKKSVKSLVFYQTHSPFPEISMLNLFSFQDQKFGHKRRGAGHSGNNGHGGKEGGLLLSVPHLVSCKGHEVYGECWDGVKSLLKQCRTNLANMSTCTSPGDHTEYCKSC